jgi:hypothetical protein
VGSDDFLRGKFEEYLCSVLAAIKLADFVAKGKDNQILITGSGKAVYLAVSQHALTLGRGAEIGSGVQSYNEAWIAAFRQTDAFGLWDRTTDPVIFDLVEPKCAELHFSSISTLVPNDRVCR